MTADDAMVYSVDLISKDGQDSVKMIRLIVKRKCHKCSRHDSLSVSRFMGEKNVLTFIFHSSLSVNESTLYRHLLNSRKSSPLQNGRKYTDQE